MATFRTGNLDFFFVLGLCDDGVLSGIGDGDRRASGLVFSEGSLGASVDVDWFDVDEATSGLALVGVTGGDIP